MGDPSGAALRASWAAAGQSPDAAAELWRVCAAQVALIPAQLGLSEGHTDEVLVGVQRILRGQGMERAGEQIEAVVHAVEEQWSYAMHGGFVGRPIAFLSD